MNEKLVGHCPGYAFMEITPGLLFSEEIIELRLCEAEHLYLKPNVVYRFTVDRNCSKCLEAERKSLGQNSKEDEDVS